MVIISSDKEVEALGPPIPLELLAFGLGATLGALEHAVLRDGTPVTPDGGLIADYLGDVPDPEALALRLDAVPGVVNHGLFTPAMVAEVLIARGDQVEHRTVSGGRR